MKMKYATPNGRIQFEVEVPNGKAAFEVAAGISELFEETECGCCKSPNIRFEVREVESGKYYQMRCGACNAQLDFGQKKDNKGMWCKRKDKDGNESNRGWYVWQSGSNSGGTNGRQHQTNPIPQGQQYRAPEQQVMSDESDIPF